MSTQLTMVKPIGIIMSVCKISTTNRSLRAAGTSSPFKASRDLMGPCFQAIITNCGLRTSNWIYVLRMGIQHRLRTVFYLFKQKKRKEREKTGLRKLKYAIIRGGDLGQVIKYNSVITVLVGTFSASCSPFYQKCNMNFLAPKYKTRNLGSGTTQAQNP